MSEQGSAPQAPKTITLPSTRAALTWDRATDALVVAAEDAEAKAKEVYETAKSAYQEARQHAHMIRQLRQIARVDGAPTRMPDTASVPRGKHAGICIAPRLCKGCLRISGEAAS